MAKKPSLFQFANSNPFVVGVAALALFAAVGFGVMAAVSPKVKAGSTAVLGANTKQEALQTKRVTACKSLLTLLCGAENNPTPGNEGCADVKLVCNGVSRSMMKSKNGMMNGQFTGDAREQRRKVILEGKKLKKANPSPEADEIN